MMTETQAAVRILVLERAMRRLTWLTTLLVVALISLVSAAFLPHAGADAPQVLRARGLILVDERGRDRIALGAPFPELRGRRRPAMGVGLLIVDSLGVDRVAIGAPTPDPSVGRRIAPASGISFYNAKGDERGSLAYLDNGRAILGLDNARGEGLGVFSFENGWSGFAVVRNDQLRAVLELDPNDATARLSLSDSAGRPRSRIEVTAAGASAWRVLDDSGHATQNLVRPNER